MAVTYSATLKTNRMQLVADLVASKTQAASTGTALAGTLVIGTSGMAATLATFNLQTTPFTVSGSVATLQGTPLSATAAATGTAAAAQIKNNAGTVIVDGLTVGTSGTDIIISSTAITSGQTVQVTSGTLTHG